MTSTADRTVVGSLVQLWRFPVKSMAGEPLEHIDVSWHGLAGDRRFAFVRPGKAASSFPWLTIRQVPTMSQYHPSLVEPKRPEASAVSVRTPRGDTLDVLDPALAARLGPGVSVIRQHRGIFDAMPLSLVSTATVRELGTRVGSALEPLRFRANLVVDAGDVPFAEEEWVGRVVRIGGICMRIDERDNRCVMVNVDPVTARRDPAVLRVIARERDNFLGVYGSTVQPGRLAIGDAVSLEP